jgi:hypothetical protein
MSRPVLASLLTALLNMKTSNVGIRPEGYLVLFPVRGG